jgi:hypothetical protein
MTVIIMKMEHESKIWLQKGGESVGGWREIGYGTGR